MFSKLVVELCSLMSELVRILCYSGFFLGSDYLHNLPWEVWTSTTHSSLRRQKPWALVMPWAPQSVPVATCGVLEARALFFFYHFLACVSVNPLYLSYYLFANSSFYDLSRNSSTQPTPPLKQKAQKEKL